MAYDYGRTPTHLGSHRTQKQLTWVKDILDGLKKMTKAPPFVLEDIPTINSWIKKNNFSSEPGIRQAIFDTSLGMGGQNENIYRQLVLDCANTANDDLITKFNTNNGATIPDSRDAQIEMQRLFDDFRVPSLVTATPQVSSDGTSISGPSYGYSKPEYTRADLLKRRKNIVLEGPPGTGKTFAMKGIIDSLVNEHHENIVDGRGRDKWAITMHPATAYEDFIEGLRPATETTVEVPDDDIGGVSEEAEDDSGSEPNQSEKKQNCSNKFEYQPGVFVKRVKDAIQKPNEKHVVLLDELNRCNVPRVLGDLLTTVEADKRTKPVIPKANSDDLWYGKDVKIGVFGSKITVAGDRETGQGLRIYAGCKITSGPGAFNAKPSKHTITYLDFDGENVKEYEESMEPGRGRQLSTLFTDRIITKTNTDTWHSIAAFLVYEDICYPMILSKDNMIQLIGGVPLEHGEYTILSNEGLKRCFISNMTNELKNKNSARHSCEMKVYSFDEKCTCSNLDHAAEYYWCDYCDDKWDSEKRTEVILSGSEKKLHIPNNLYIVATMNTTDRSVAPLDAALRRRFVFIRVDPLLKESLPDELEKSIESMEDKEIYTSVIDLWDQLNKKLRIYLGDDATIGHSYLFEFVEQIKEDNKIETGLLAQQFWQYSVLPQVADLLDATGNPTLIWQKFDLEEQFKAFGIKITTPSEELQSRAFARTIVRKS